MNNTSILFENLMLMHESDKESGHKIPKKKLQKINESKKIVNEADTTLLNLTVEIPSDTEDIEPEDVKVDVGVMPIETEDDVEDEVSVDEDETPEDVTPEDEDEDTSKEESEEDEENEPEKEESLQLEGKDCKCTGKEDCECENCKSKKEATDVDAAKKRIMARTNGEEECSKTIKEGIFKKKNKKDNKDVKTQSVKAMDLKKGDSVAFGNGSNTIVKKITNIKSMGNGLGKDYIRDYAITYDDGKEERLEQDVKRNKVVNESLMHLDTTSLNKLITNFVKENYKNIDKVVITKAMLENKVLTLSGVIKDLNGKKESIILTNRGFDSAKLENKRFLIDFADKSNTFSVMKESIKKPFIFTATLKDGNLKFESLKYNFKTRINESKVAEIYGNCVLTENVKLVNENADQVKTFNEIIDKIKGAKSANDLTACKDELDNSNIGDTLFSAAQMVWDDVNSRMKG